MTWPFRRFPIISACMLISLILATSGGHPAQSSSPPISPLSPGALQPVVREPLRHDRSPALRSLNDTEMPAPRAAGVPRYTFPKVENSITNRELQSDPALQSLPAVINMPATGFNFEGVNNINGVMPPDTNGDIGPNHYVQWVNLSLAIWELDRGNQTATLVYGPVPGSAIWQGFGSACETSNDGDPIVLYDHLADRWLISQFALPNFPSGPYYQCLAVSQSGDPTAGWYRYVYLASNTKMNDYPHLGVWPDGYYMSANQFTNGASWGGAGVFAFERDKMLLGQTARMVYFDLYTVNPSFGGMLPADLDGPPPDPGAPNLFAEVDDASWIPNTDALRLWEFHVDWTNPANSTFGVAGNPNAILPVANFAPLCEQVLECIPQPATNRRLDAIADRLMHRLQFRQSGAYASLVTNHTVDAGGGRAAVRWYELRQYGTGWDIHQQGTYAGDGANSEHRWMGSAAMDKDGNLAIGYSVSSGAVYPSIRYTGRLAGDPLNTLPQGENTLFAGSGSQTSSYARWGDYTMLGVDPTDDCTFWYTNEYLQFTSEGAWRTRVGSFTFPTCTANLTGSLEGRVTDASDSAPLPSALIQAGSFSTLTNTDGKYFFPDLPVGSYTVSASHYGYDSQVVGGIAVSPQITTTQDFGLAPLAPAVVSGHIYDGSGQDWPLYARLDISAPGYAETLFSNPASGLYTATLTPGLAHTIQLQAFVSGYLPQTVIYTPTVATSNQDFWLYVDESACLAPGYTLLPSGCQPASGGLLLGHVLDGNNDAAINGASVYAVSEPLETSLSQPTPDDPAVQDGFFILFSSNTGSQTFAANADYYGEETQSLTLKSGDIVTTTFSLPAGRLDIDPASLGTSLDYAQTASYTLTFSNTGIYTAAFSLTEVDAPPPALNPSGPFASPTRHVSPKHLADPDASSVYLYTPPAVDSLPAGKLVNAWPSGLAHPWGLGFDSLQAAIWLGDLALGGGLDQNTRYTPEGEPASTSLDLASLGAYFNAGMAYDPFRRLFWQVSVGGEGCLFAFDPQGPSLTGERLCPPFNNSPRGLAFNPLDGTFYAGAWTDGVLYHFDSQGTILDSANLELNIAGMAFNPGSGHLFILSNAALGYDVYVVDANDGYLILGGFDIPGLDSYQQAGLALDCDGYLWAVNQQTGQVLQVESGETGACAYAQVPWLAVTPTSGELSAGESGPVIFTLTATGLAAGNHQAHVLVSNDTPYGLLTIPVELQVMEHYAYQLPSTSMTRSGLPGSEVSFALELTNTGNITDAYSLSSSGNPWSVKHAASLGPLAMGASLTFTATVTVPDSAIPGATTDLLLTLASNGDPALVTGIQLSVLVAHEVRLPFIAR